MRGTGVPSTSVAAGGAHSLTRVQRGPTGPPVYCFHPLSGSVALYGELAAHIGRDRVVYGLQAAGLAPDTAPDRTVLEMAARYAGEIATDPPTTGSIFLGYSMGGVVAVETARLLGEQLIRPPRPVLVDCDPLYTSDEGGFWQILVHQTLNLDMPLASLDEHRTEHDRLALIRDVAAGQGRLPNRFSLNRLAAMLRVCAANERAVATHVPAYFPGAVHTVRSSGAAPTPDADPWYAFAARVEVSVLPTDHHSIMTPAGYPHIAGLVRELLADRP